MKHSILVLFVCLFLFPGCTAQKGTVEVEALSKKVFESLRDDDFGGLREIIPNESSFKKILAMQEKDENVDVRKSFDAFLMQSETDFKNVRSKLKNWDGTVYMNTIHDTSKEESVAFASVATKFKQGEILRKLSFTAAKVGGRWFYYSGLTLNEKDSQESATSATE